MQNNPIDPTTGQLDGSGTKYFAAVLNAISPPWRAVSPRPC
jgi:hypothetical protein